MLVTLLCACGDSEQFRISGSISGNPTMNLRVHYIGDGTDNHVSLVTAARDGAFEFTGNAPRGTVVEVYDYDNHLLGRTYVLNGQELTLRLDRSNPWNIEASGNEMATAWADFLRANADSAGTAGANDLIADYICNNPSSIISTLLLVSEFNAGADPAGADSLMQLIDPSARPAVLTEGFNYLLQRMVQETASRPLVPFPYLDRKDSLRMLRTSDSRYTLLAIDNNRCGRDDSIVPALRRLSDRRHRNQCLGIVEFSLDQDTLEWKRSTRRDTATWTQAWAAGGFAGRGIAPLAVPSVPFFIVCDSAGTQLLRTTSITLAADSLSKLLQKH